MRIGWSVAVLLAVFSNSVVAQDVTVNNGASTVDIGVEPQIPPRNRVLGFLPNHGTVEQDVVVVPISPRGMIEATAKNTFDPVIFPFVGLTTMVGHRGSRTYAERYATALADNTLGNFLASAVWPSLPRQDPRYDQRGTGRSARRALSAVSRIACDTFVHLRADPIQCVRSVRQSDRRGDRQRILPAHRAIGGRDADAVGHAGVVG